eukprot:6460846-Amphidinium_carterae.4
MRGGQLRKEIPCARVSARRICELDWASVGTLVVTLAAFDMNTILGKSLHATFPSRLLASAFMCNTTPVFNASRGKDLIQIMTEVATRRGYKADATFIDVSQSVERYPVSEGFHALTTRASIFSLGQQRRLSGHEHLSIHGLPTVDGMGDFPLRNLAGESMGAPAAATMLLALCGCLMLADSPLE